MMGGFVDLACANGASAKVALDDRHPFVGFCLTGNRLLSLVDRLAIYSLKLIASPGSKCYSPRCEDVMKKILLSKEEMEARELQKRKEIGRAHV